MPSESEELICERLTPETSINAKEWLVLQH